MLNNREEAEDALQDVLAKLWQQSPKISQYASAEAFAMIITRNSCIDLIRKRKNNIVDFDTDFLSSNEILPDKYMEQKDISELIRAVIDSLPEQQRMIIHLRDVEGYDNGEIADIAGVSVNNVKVNLSRARKKIRDILIERYKYENK